MSFFRFVARHFRVSLLGMNFKKLVTSFSNKMINNTVKIQQNAEIDCRFPQAGAPRQKFAKAYLTVDDNELSHPVLSLTTKKGQQFAVLFSWWTHW